MRDLAVELGVPAEALALEADSMTTVENARCCREAFDFDKVIVVTCPAHVHRCQSLFEGHFTEVAGVPSRRGPNRDWRLFLRETAIGAWWG